MKAFVTSYFPFCPLTWMLHSSNMKHINKIHERALNLVYNGTPNVSSDELLVKDKSVSLHQKKLQLFASEIFKVKNGIVSELLSDIFQFVKKPDNLRNASPLNRKLTLYNSSEARS